MLIWGTREKWFKGGKTYPQRCEGCGKWEHVGCVLAHYFHVFFIPVYLREKQVGLLCAKCGSFSSGDRITPAIRDEVRRTAFSPLRRAPYFAGLVLLTLLLALAGMGKVEHDQRVQALVADPQKGDVYLVNLPNIFEFFEGGERRYGTLRISDISPTHLLFDVGKFLGNRQGHFREDARTGRVFQDNYYDGSVLLQERSSLAALLDNGTIVDIYRK